MRSDERALLVSTLVYHQRVDDPPYAGICACGWRVLGASWAEHVADVYDDARAFTS